MIGKLKGKITRIVAFVASLCVAFCCCFGLFASSKEKDTITASATYAPVPATDWTGGLLDIYVQTREYQYYHRYFAYLGGFVVNNFYSFDFYIEALNNGDSYGSMILLKVFYSGVWDMYALPVNEVQVGGGLLLDNCIMTSAERPAYLFDDTVTPQIVFFSEYWTYSCTEAMVDVFNGSGGYAVRPTALYGTYEYASLYNDNTNAFVDRWRTVISYKSFSLYPTKVSDNYPSSGRIYTSYCTVDDGENGGVSSTILPPSSPSGKAKSVYCFPFMRFNSSDAGGYSEEQYVNYGNSQYAQGVQDGQASGYNNGYNQGYQKGLDTADSGNFVNAVSVVLGAPVTVVSQFLNFEILGYNMLAFVSGLLTLMIIIKIIKMFV